MTRIIALPIALLFAAVALAGPAATDDARVARPGAAAPAAPAPGPDLTRPLDDLVNGKGKLDEVRLHVHWFANPGGRQVTVYGNGVGLWNNEKQFNLAAGQVIELLKMLQKAKFTAMPGNFGGLNFPGGRGPRPGAPERLLGSVTLTIGGATKGSSQVGGGEQSKELAALANELLDFCEKAARNGVAVASLTDGLQLIAKKQLMPETLAIMTQRIQGEGIGPDGWILRINGRTAEVQVRSKAGISDPYRLELTEKQLGEVIKLLTDNQVAGLPINLYAQHYTDFDVRLLKHNKNLQARKFAGLTPEKHGEKQKNFDRIFAGLEKLQAQVVKEGKQVKVVVQ